MNPNQYLALLKEKNITPNWWCSEEYFQKAGLSILREEDAVKVMDGDIQMFPSLDIRGGKIFKESDSFWSDFLEYTGEDFLDYEYIYDPKSFENMNGKSWQVFRKNSRKFPKRYGKKLIYKELDEEYDKRSLLESWISGLKSDSVEDFEVLIDYFYNGNFQKGLIDNENNLLGVNIWDENFKYINYRYCICYNEPFLSEYLRLLFYLDIQFKNKSVNDGGILGNENLKRFKNKMNPIKIRKVLSKNE